MDYTLETARLLLRPFSATDFEGVHEYAKDPEVTRYTSFGPNTVEETRSFLTRQAADAQKHPRVDFGFAIVLKESERLIGACGVGLQTGLEHTGELGYVLHRDYWRQGYAPEAAAEILRFGFEELGIHRVFAWCHPENPASARVMQKLGMSYEGRLKECIRVRGEWWDFLQYAIIEPEWSKSRSGRGQSGD